MGTFFHSYPGPDARFELVVEDNGRVAYAYLVSNKNIVGDVWLYNSTKAPEAPEWTDKAKLPFMNPASFSSQVIDFRPLQSPGRIKVSWRTDQVGDPGVKIFIDEVLHATLAVGEKPGCCRFARKSGPLAKTLQ